MNEFIEFLPVTKWPLNFEEAIFCRGVFHEIAEKEFIDAIEYYEECQAGLGERFSEEVYATIKRICEHPYAWTDIDAKTRRCLTNKFPYGILYRVVNNHIRIMAVMHLHRKPDYWQGR